MRKVIFTESQIRRIIMEDIGFGGAYNPEQYEDHKESYNDAEIGTSDKDDNGDRVDAIITDLLGSEKCRNGYPFGFGSHCHNSRQLEEQNQNLKNSYIEIPKRIINQLPPGERTDNLKKNPKVSVNTADKITFDTPSNSLIHKFLKDQLHTKRENDKTIRKTKENNGFIKHHEKKGTGTAHTKKPEIPVTFTYED